jgi:hypothetical protein
MAENKKPFKELLSKIFKNSVLISSLLSALVALIIGIYITRYGVNLQARLDNQKYERDIKNNQDMSISILCDELKSNSNMIKENLDIRNKEFDSIKKNNLPIIGPLIPLQTGAWDLLKTNRPTKFIPNDMILEINNYNQEIIIVNKIIETRENFKILKMGLLNYQSDLEQFNYLLEKRLKILENYIFNINQKLSSECKRVNLNTN